MISVQDIVDIYKRTGLKPSISYRNHEGCWPNQGKLISGCIITAIYCDENKYDCNVTLGEMVKYAEKKLGSYQASHSLESGFCGWGLEENDDSNLYKIGAKAAEILFTQNEEE